MKRLAPAVLALCLLACLTAPGVGPARWVHVIPLGARTLRDDRRICTDHRDAQAVVGSFGKRNVGIPVLYEHGDGPRGGVAAGWVMALEIRSNGVWALFQCVQPACSEVMMGGWLYISGRFNCKEDARGCCHPRGLEEISLTNMPAFGGLEPTIGGLAVREPGR
jgi:phage I-like protein